MGRPYGQSRCLRRRVRLINISLMACKRQKAPVIVLPDLNPGKIRVVKINGRNGKVDWTSVLNSAPDPTKTLNRAFCKTNRAGAVVGTADGGALFVGSKKGQKESKFGGFAKFSKLTKRAFLRTTTSL